jgi:uncharacterized delta-60 repeat protein
MKRRIILIFRKSIYIGIILLFTSITTVIAITYLDPQFGAPQGYISLDGTIPTISIQEDGRILVMLSDINQLVRLSMDGSLDASFGSGGAVTIPVYSGIVAGTTTAGEIMVVGKCSGYSDEVFLQRFLANGQPDPAFNGGTSICQALHIYLPFVTVDEAVVQPDGKTVVRGTAIFVGDSIGGYSFVARFDQNGNLDPSFGSDGLFSAFVPANPGGSSFALSDMDLQPGGKILLTGTVSDWSYPGVQPIYLVAIRLTDTGAYDPTFNGDGIFTYYDPVAYRYGDEIAIQHNNRIMIGGFEKRGGVSTPFLLGLNSGGTIDTSFSTTGIRTLPERLAQILILPYDHIVTSSLSEEGLAIRMYRSDGAIETTFANGGQAVFDFLGNPMDLNIEPDGQIVIASSSDHTFVARMGSDIGPSPTFEDVNWDYWAYSFIDRLYTNGITTGCSSNPLMYCPEQSVTRAQMAVFLERGVHGSTYQPPAVGAGSGFNDVSTSYWAAAWIKQLAADGVTTGCGGGNYCPEGMVTRGQMAVFLLRARYGAAYIPPTVGSTTGFYDVPTTYWAAAWIKQLAAESITTGCGGGNYCPEDSVTRAQMAVFLVRTFNLP